MRLENLETYTLARSLNDIVWNIYQNLDWRDRKTMGDQFLTSVDSVGANIAEGFGRYHYLDKNKFNYNARGSLLESFYWLEVLRERGRIKAGSYGVLKTGLDDLHLKLNNYINATRRQTLKKA